jgi:hypothetical protein
MARVALVLAFTIWCTPPATVIAQTVETMVAAAETAANSGGLAKAAPEAYRALLKAREALGDAGVLSEPVDEFVRRYASPGALTLAHRNGDRHRAAVGEAIDTLKFLANTGFPLSSIPVPEALSGPIARLQDAENDAGLTLDREALRRFERKYGPGSAKLNGVETLLAYGLQRIPAFGVGLDGPGPLEAIASYSAAYLTYSAEQARLVSVAEFGLRTYIFAAGWGTGRGRLSWLKPRYLSYGMSVAGQPDEPMQSPLAGNARIGGFFGWGELKAAFLLRGEKRLLVTQQVQIIPWVF